MAMVVVGGWLSCCGVLLLGCIQLLNTTTRAPNQPSNLHRQPVVTAHHPSATTRHAPIRRPINTNTNTRPTHLGVLQRERVRRDADVERVGLRPALALELALLGGAVVRQQLERGAPLLELHLPVEHHAGGHHHQARAPVAPAGRCVNAC